MKRILSLVLAISLILSTLVIAYAEEVEPKRMNREQLQVAASYFFWRVITDDHNSEWDSNDSFQEPIPLYSDENEIIAYYIKTVNHNGSVNGYMVVNAFIDNPCVLEYGYGETVANEIDNYVTNSDNKIYYGLNGTFSDKKSNDTAKEKSYTNTSHNDRDVDLVSLLSTKNYELKETITQIYNEKFVNNYTQNSSRSTSLSDWGIIKLDDMPSGSYTEDSLYRLDNVSSWAKTSDAPNLDNHCGPTSGTNMLLYYGAKLRTSFIQTNYENTIEELYDYMGTNNAGTGPYGYAQGIRDYMSDYYPSRSVTFYIYSSTYSWDTLQSNISDNIITAAYLWSNTIIGGTHYVNYVGWRSYSDGSNYVRITTQWSTDDDKYILYNFSHTRMVEQVVEVEIS